MKNATGLTWREDLQQLQKIMRLLHQLLRNNWPVVLCYLLFSHKIYIFRWIWTSGLPKSSNEALSPSWGLRSTIIAHCYQIMYDYSHPLEVWDPQATVQSTVYFAPFPQESETCQYHYFVQGAERGGAGSVEGGRGGSRFAWTHSAGGLRPAFDIFLTPKRYRQKEKVWAYILAL